MTKHVQHVTDITAALECKKDAKTWFSKDVSEDRTLLRNLIVHAGDLANPTKPTGQMTKWTAGVALLGHRVKLLYSHSCHSEQFFVYLSSV